MRFPQRFRSDFLPLLCALTLMGLPPLASAQSAPAVNTASPVAATTATAAAPNNASATVAIATTPTPSTAAAQVTAPAPNFSGNVLQLALGLAVVLALMVGALWLIKQLTQRRGAASGLLKVVAGAAVGPRERVVIVEVGTTWLVLGVAPGRVTPLAEVPRQAAPAPSPGTPETRRPTAADFLRTAGGAQA